MSVKSLILRSGALVAAALTMGAAPPASPRVELTRLNCGSVQVKEFNSFFSDTLEYKPGPRTLASSCYLIRHMDQYMLWDTGFPAAMIGKPDDMGAFVATMTTSIADQLKSLGLKRSDIDVVVVSHMHPDHVGQAAEFPDARLVIGKGDFAATAGDKDPFAPWRKAGARLTEASGDVDIFGDGSVIALRLPGHTPGHLGLLVRLASGPVLLSGDLYHASEARALRGVPPFNLDRADTLASFDRFERLAKQLNARVIIQHDAADVTKLPAFPKAAR